MAKLLIAKRRIGEVEIPAITTDKVGIYLNPNSGMFYALFPEVEGDGLTRGVLYQEPKMADLRAKVEQAMREHYTLTYRRVLRVYYPAPVKDAAAGPGASMHLHQRTHQGWVNMIPERGSCVLGPLTWRPWEIATLADGSLRGSELVRDQTGAWVPLDTRRGSRVGAMDPNDGVELPFDPALIPALEVYQEAIRATDLKIRALLRGALADPAALTAQAARPLLAGPAPE